MAGPVDQGGQVEGVGCLGVPPPQKQVGPAFRCKSALVVPPRLRAFRFIPSRGHSQDPPQGDQAEAGNTRGLFGLVGTIDYHGHGTPLWPYVGQWSLGGRHKQV